MSNKIQALKSRLGATKLSDMADRMVTLVHAEVIPPRDDDGYPAAILVAADGVTYRSTSAAVIDFVAAANDVLETIDGVWEEPVSITPKYVTSQRGRQYLTVVVD